MESSLLAICGWKKSNDEFEVLMKSIWHDFFVKKGTREQPTKFFTVENMLHTPKYAAMYCDFVRQASGLNNLIDHNILHELTKIRKDLNLNE